jgi:methylthioribose-1-phosphate isomerase
MAVKTIQWIDDKIRIIDQTQLPEKLVYLDIDRLDVLGEAIENLRVRGAPAIGIAGAMGVALAAQAYPGDNKKELIDEVDKVVDFLGSTRPTAVNLFWALDRMKGVLISVQKNSVPQIKRALVEEALNIFEEDREICRRMGRHGAELLPQNAVVLTHCNAGGLATADFGTALGVIYAAVETGKTVRVFADETRPLLQGSRLTAWELHASGVEVTILCDSASGFLMSRNRIDCILVGADRISANGDTANKIGTYSLAVLAEKHHVPFYVVAPVSTFDFSLDSGSRIPIEERSAHEVTQLFGRKTGPDDVPVFNPAFDVTPHELVTAFVTEAGVLYPPFEKSFLKISPHQD